MEPLIKVENLSRVFKGSFWEKDFQALKEVSFCVHPGRATGFLGANGAGKTTTMKIIMDFISASSGKVHFSKDLGSNSREAIAGIGFVPERPYFYQHLTGRDFLHYMGRLSKVSAKTLEAQIHHWAPLLSIDFALEREIRGYSKGMLQRLGFLSALLHDPKLLILDEPLSGLDPLGRRDLKQVMKDLVKQGKSLLVSSHIIPDIEEVCRDVVVLEKGEVLFEGQIDEILTKAQKNKMTIEYCSQDGGKFFNMEVTREQLNQQLKKMIEDQVVIQSVTPSRVSLEEIIYRL